MARWSSTAATDESTPPDRPSTTRSSPIFSFSSRTELSTNDSELQFWLHPQMPTTKFLSNCRPSVE